MQELVYFWSSFHVKHLQKNSWLKTILKKVKTMTIKISNLEYIDVFELKTFGPGFKRASTIIFKNQNRKSNERFKKKRKLFGRKHQKEGNTLVSRKYKYDTHGFFKVLKKVKC